MDDQSISDLINEGLKQGKIKQEDRDFFIEALKKTSLEGSHLLPGYVGVHFGLDGWWHHRTHRTDVAMPRGVIINKEFEYEERGSERQRPLFKVQISSLDEYLDLRANKQLASVINGCQAPYSLLIRVDRAAHHRYDLIVPGVSDDPVKLKSIAEWAAGTLSIIRF